MPNRRRDLLAPFGMVGTDGKPTGMMFEIANKIAETAGLKVQDIILTLDGKPVINVPQFDAAFQFRADPAPLQLEVVRASEKVSVQIPVIEQHDDMDRLADSLDPAKDLIPVHPTCHYMMGGIPVNAEGNVTDENNRSVPGLYAAGECSCVSIHGANRLGCNSLLDLVVFGRRAGMHILENLDRLDWIGPPETPERDAVERIGRLMENKKGEKPVGLRRELQQTMMDGCAVFRDEPGLRKVVETIGELEQRARNISIDNSGKRFNTDLIDGLELLNMIPLAEAIAASALNRTESRGAHSRQDYPERDDVHWLNHTLVRRTHEGVSIDLKPVAITRFQPKARTY